MVHYFSAAATALHSGCHHHHCCHLGRVLLQKHGRRADDISSIELVTSEGAYVKLDAILKITQALLPPFIPAATAANLGQLMIPRFLHDLSYDQVTNNQYQLMGKCDTCCLDAEGTFIEQFVKEEMAHREV